MSGGACDASPTAPSPTERTTTPWRRSFDGDSAETTITKLLEALEAQCFERTALFIATLNRVAAQVSPTSGGDPFPAQRDSPPTEAGSIEREQQSTEEVEEEDNASITDAQLGERSCGCSLCVGRALQDEGGGGGGIPPGGGEPISPPAVIRLLLRKRLSRSGERVLLRSVMNRLTSGVSDEEAFWWRLSDFGFPALIRPVSQETQDFLLEYVLRFPIPTELKRSANFVRVFVRLLHSVTQPRGTLPPSAWHRAETVSRLYLTDAAMPNALEATEEPCPSVRSLPTTPSAASTVRIVRRCLAELFGVEPFERRAQRDGNGDGAGDGTPNWVWWDYRVEASRSPSRVGSTSDRFRTAAVVLGRLLVMGCPESIAFLTKLSLFPSARLLLVVSRVLHSAFSASDLPVPVERIILESGAASTVPSPHPFIAAVRLEQRLYSFCFPGGTSAPLADDGAAQQAESSLPPARRIAVTPYFLHLVFAKLGLPFEVYGAVEPYCDWSPLFPKRCRMMMEVLHRVLYPKPP